MATANHHIDDAGIISLLRQPGGLEDALHVLYEQHFESLRRFIQNNSGTWHQAQEVIERVMSRFAFMVVQGKFKDERGIKHFLYALNKDFWIEELIRQGKLVRAADDHLIPSYRDLHYELLKVFRGLGESCKKLLTFFYLERQAGKGPLSEKGPAEEKKIKCLSKFENSLNHEEKLLKELTALLHG